MFKNINHLNDFFDVDEGLDVLIKKNIMRANNYEELINLVKTKRYTYNRLNRMFLHIYLNIKKKDQSRLKKITYLKVLGFSKKGQQYLKDIKKKSKIPLITNYSDLKDDNLQQELYIAYLYHLLINKEELNIQELKSIPIQKEGLS